MTTAFSATFWGVRGVAPTTDSRARRYGGDTSCVEVRCGGHVFLLDLGTGARRLGARLAQERVDRMTVLLSHAHYDHVMGLPFFAPLRREGARVAIASTIEGGAPALISGLLRPPFFPVGPEILRADIESRDLAPGGRLDGGDGIELSTCATTHGDRAVAWRIAFQGRSLVYAPDHQTGDRAADAALSRFSAGADLLIHDATLLHEDRCGRDGHSTWRGAVDLAERAGARRLALFHHDPTSGDARLDRLAGTAAEARAGTVVARAGLVIAL